MKHMNSRRILAMLLALCMMVGMLSMTAFATDAATTGSENSGEKGTKENPYSLDEFNALRDIAGKEVWVNINVDLTSDTSKCETVGNYKMSDEYTWVSDGAEVPAGFTATERRNAQDNATAYITHKEAATVHVTGSLKMANYSNGSFSGFQTLYFQLPAASTVVLENMILTGSFNLSGSYVYMYNLRDGSIGHQQSPKPEGYTNIWYGYPIVIENIKLSGCTVNGQWFANGTIAKNVEIDACTFNDYENTGAANWANPLWWKNMGGMVSLTIKNCQVTSTRPMKVGEGTFGGRLTVDNNAFEMLEGDKYTQDSSDKSKNSALILYGSVGGDIAITGNTLKTAEGVRQQLLAIGGSTIGMPEGATFEISNNKAEDGTLLSGTAVAGPWKDEASEADAVKQFVESTVTGNNTGSGSSETAVATVGSTSYNNLEDAFAALDGTNHTLTLTAAGETAWTYENVYWMASGQTGSAATLKDAMTAAYAADANSITIICKPNAKIAMSNQHINVTDDITIYANGADFCHCNQTKGRNDDLSIGTYAAPTGGKATVNVYDAKNLTVWGQPVSGRNDEWTVNLVNCENDGHGMIMYRNEADFTSKIYVTLTGCKATGYAESIVHTTADGSIMITDCEFTSNCAPVNIAHKQNGEMTVSVKNTKFDTCGKVDTNNYFAPVRIVNNNETGAVNVSVDGCTFANTVGVNGDILLGDGRTGKESHDVSLTVKNTAAKVMAQKPGYYGATGTVDNGTLGNTQDVAEFEEVTTSVETLLPPAAEGVAKITRGGADVGTYATLAEAFAAAADGDTITLLSDCSGNGIVVKANTFMKSGLTVDFGKHTYTVGGVLVGSATTGTNAFQLNAGNKITFKNGGIVGVAENTKPAEDTPNWHGAPAIVIQNYCDLTLDSMTITGGDETVYTMSNNCGNITINNTTINAGKAKGYTSPAFAFDVYGGWYKDDVTVTVTGNSVINGDIEIDRDTGDSKNTLKLEGCTVNGTLKIGDGAVNNNMAMVTKTDATILENEVAGHKWVDGKLTLDEKYVARIGTDKYFETLEAAVAGAADGNTIVLLKDSSGNGIKVEANKFATGLTVDFGGHTYTFSGTPVGSTGSETQAAHFESGNKITLKNGKFNVSGETDANGYKVVAPLKILLQNYADLTLDNMILDGTNVSTGMEDLITLSTNNGAVEIIDTQIIAPDKPSSNYYYSYAISVCGFQGYNGTSVKVTGSENGTSTITGNIKLIKEGTGNYKLKLELDKGTSTGKLVFKDITPEKVMVSKTSNFTVGAPDGYEWSEVGALVAKETPENPVAETGGTQYATLQEAINAAAPGATVTLMADITVEKSVVINKNLMLKFDHHTITGGTDVEVLKIFSSDENTIKVKLQGNKDNEYEDGKQLPTGGINGGSGGNNQAVSVGSNAEVTIRYGTYTVGGDANGEGNSTIYVYDNGIVNIVDGGTFSSEKPYRGLYYVLNRKNGCTGTFNVKAGTFVNYNPLKGDDNDGGNFCAVGKGLDVSLDSNNKPQYTVKTGIYQVLDKDGNPVKAYTSVTTMLSAIENGQTVMLLRNTTANITIPAGKDFTLDLNGKTLSGGKNNGNATIKNCGTVVIDDSSKEKAGRIIREDVGNETGTTYYVIRNLGTMTIKNGTIYNNSGYEKANSAGSMEGSSLICNSDDDAHPATLNIEGGTLEQENFIAIKNGSSGTLFMTGGTVKSGHSAIQNWHDATITGGKVIGQLWTDSYIDEFSTGKTVFGGEAEFEGEIVMDITGNIKPTLEIKGGELDVTSWRVTNGAANAGARPEVSGGTFTREVPADYCKDGFVPTTLDGGKYGVELAKGDVKLIGADGNVRYGSIADAIENETIQLYKDITVDGVYLRTGRTLDLNGWTLTTEYVQANTGRVIDSSDGKGKLIVSDETVTFNVDAEYLPLYDGTEYRFFEYKFELKKAEFTDSTKNVIKLNMWLYFSNLDAYDILIEHADGAHGIDLRFIVSWPQEGKVDQTWELRVPAATISSVYKQVRDNNPQNYGIGLNIKGLNLLPEGTEYIDSMANLRNACWLSDNFVNSNAIKNELN